MRYLSFAITAEGVTDEAFLWTVVFRTLWEVICEKHIAGVELAETQIFFPRLRNKDRADIICRDRLAFDLFFIHFDSTNASKSRLYETLFSPITKLAHANCDVDPVRIIPICTVNEMEGWVLVDPDSIAFACGYEGGWPNSIPVSWDPEHARSISDPKAVLKTAVTDLRRSNHVSGEEILEVLGSAASRLDLGKLNSVAEYLELKSYILNALRSFGCYQD